MVVKTFRGQLADGGQDHIRLQTIKGKVGYRIIKLELFPFDAGTNDYEALVKVFKTEQSSVPTSSGTANFTDSDILAASLYTATSVTAASSITSIFDNEIFNQDIFITHTGNTGNSEINYYIELEVIPLTDSDAEFTTLKDIRGRNTTP